MPDFTIKTYSQLLHSLKYQGFTLQPFPGFIKDPAFRTIILRHDVDARKKNSLKTAQIENELGIHGTYYFRMVPQSYDEEVIKKIVGLGHEIGYHYEDVSSMDKRQKIKVKRQKWEEKERKTQDGRHTEEDLFKLAIESFSDNLESKHPVCHIFC